MILSTINLLKKLFCAYNFNPKIVAVNSLGANNKLQTLNADVIADKR